MALRLFLAMDVPEELKAALGRAMEDTEPDSSGMKWVRPANIHFTLKFLGNVEEEKVEALANAVREVTGVSPSVEISTGGFGAFPRPERARVFWLGLETGKAALSELARDFNGRLRALRFEAEKRPFAAHITLARLRQARDISNLIEAWEQTAGVRDVAWRGNEVVLYQSVLDRTGPTYTALERFELKG